jgi:pyruvate/2-oxoglutarate/acetoin dehydrogenase E1 component
MKQKPSSEPSQPINNAHVERKRNNTSILTPHAAVDMLLAARAANKRRQVEAQIRVMQKLPPIEDAIRARVPEHERGRLDKMLLVIEQDETPPTES